MQEQECNSQNYERNALLTFMNPAVTAGHWLGVGKICTTPAYESFIWMLFGLLWNMIQNMMLYYTIHKIRATIFTSPTHQLPFGQCIVEQTTLPLLNSLTVYCRQSCKNVPTVPTSWCYFFWPVLIFGKSTRKTGKNRRKQAKTGEKQALVWC